MVVVFFASFLPSKSNLSSQAILCDVPRLQYIIVVDVKPTSWSDMPRGITIYNMEAVKELGSKAVHSEFMHADKTSF